MIWNDFNSTFLTNAQKTKAAEFAAIGEALKTNPNPDISGVTYSQMRSAEAKMRELQTLIGPAMRGLKHVKDKMEADAVQTYKNANP